MSDNGKLLRDVYIDSTGHIWYGHSSKKLDDDLEMILTLLYEIQADREKYKDQEEPVEILYEEDNLPPNYMTIKQYCEFRGIDNPKARSQKRGYSATAACRAQGIKKIMTNKATGAYPMDVLDRVIKERPCISEPLGHSDDFVLEG